MTPGRHPGVIAQGLPAANAARKMFSACRQNQGQRRATLNRQANCGAPNPRLLQAPPHPDADLLSCSRPTWVPWENPDAFVEDVRETYATSAEIRQPPAAI
jgi:hypothetical protein